MSTDVATLVSANIDLWTTAIERKPGGGRGSGHKVSLYGVERLRQLILDLAVRGKIVPQDAGDEPVTSLLKRIDMARSKLIEDGFIRGAKAELNRANVVAPFSIPPSWAWIRLDRLNCIALLDEPDAFLHPEWQFDFLKQINAISEQAARTNHFLLSSHSASTIASEAPGRLRLFEVGATGVRAEPREKADLIRSLSAGLITFSETEAALNIEQLVANTTGSVLFTEGVTDAEIVKTAWDKLFPRTPRSFDIVQCFDCGHMRKQMGRQELYQANPGRNFFALFDFDKAYGDWAAVGKVKPAMLLAGGLAENDVERGLACQRPDQPGFAMLLPIPAGLSVRNQVCNPNTGKTYGDESRLTIELLFRDVPGLEQYFSGDPEHPAGWIRFVGSKVAFAQQVIPDLPGKYFEPFRPTFEFILAKIGQP